MFYYKRNGDVFSGKVPEFYPQHTEKNKKQAEKTKVFESKGD